MLTKAHVMLYNNTRARKIPRQLYFSTIYNWREVSVRRKKKSEAARKRKYN